LVWLLLSVWILMVSTTPYPSRLPRSGVWLWQGRCQSDPGFLTRLTTVVKRLTVGLTRPLWLGMGCADGVGQAGRQGPLGPSTGRYGALVDAMGIVAMTATSAARVSVITSTAVTWDPVVPDRQRLML
jgi:hypothetical protein